MPLLSWGCGQGIKSRGKGLQYTSTLRLLRRPIVSQNLYIAETWSSKTLRLTLDMRTSRFTKLGLRIMLAQSVIATAFGQIFGPPREFLRYNIFSSSTDQTTCLMHVIVPACALECVSDPPLGGCASTDVVCLCESPTFIDFIESCFQSNCQGSNLTSAEHSVSVVCDSVGVSSLPDSTPTHTPY